MISKILSDSQIEKIHNVSLRILEEVGVEIPHKEVLSRFADTGAKIDFDKQRVRIPADVVLKCIRQAKKQYTLYGRDINKKACFGQGIRNYNTIAGEAMWVDEIGQVRRYATLQDVITATRFADGLEYITIPGAMSDPAELPVAWRCVAVLAEMIRNTTKPLTFWLYDRASTKYIVEMIVAMRGDVAKASQMPLTYAFLEPISPLRFPFDGIDLLFETSRINMPVSVGPMAQMGMSAPGTIAGTAAMENAEILAGICVTQLVKPGTAVCYGGICHAFDMSTTQMIFGGPEQAIFGVVMTQMGKSYGFPVYINVGLTDSKRPDGQAGLEAGVTLVSGAAAGADIFGHMGICGVDQATSLDMLVLQHEVIGYVESVMREMNISDEAFGFELIKQLGPGGIFIDQMHTARNFRQELWFPKLLNREYYQSWLDKGQISCEQRCNEIKREILASHNPAPASNEIEKSLTEIVKAARKNLEN
ncbi:MAG: trimethylamine methyltransferase family protein [Sedimentisphaerales bacterium]